MAVQIENNLYLKIEGREFDDYVFMEVSLSKELMKPNELNFSMRKKSLTKTPSDDSFSISDKLLGASVECGFKTSYLDHNQELKEDDLCFKGIVFKAIARSEHMNVGMVIHCTAYSPDYLLFDSPHCTSFEQSSLSEIVSKATEDYKVNISLQLTPRMDGIIPYTVQYNETTYAFLSRLAQRYGEFFYFENDELVFGKMKQPKQKIKLYPDIDILGYYYETNLFHVGFSHADHDYLEYENQKDLAKNYGSQSFNKLTEYAYNHSTSLFKKDTLQDNCASIQEDNGLNQVVASVMNDILGTKAQLMVCKGVSNRCDLHLGTVFSIQEYSGDVEDKNLQNHEDLMMVSLSYHWNLNGHFQCEFSAIPASSEYPPCFECDVYPMAESQRAVVVDNKDPEKLGRIRVRLLWQELQDEYMITPWLRITQPHGGDGKGFYFIPEIGEEVMLGFEHGNAEKPFVIGTLYHGKQHPEGKWYSGSNDIKALRTRNGHTVEIHDVAEGGFIRIYDNEKENYVLTYSTDEKLIKLQSKGNIELYADNDIIIDAKHDIKVSAGNDRNTEIGNNDALKVGNDQTNDIQNDMATSVGKDKTVSVGNDFSLEVGERIDVAARNIKTDAAENHIMYAKKSVQKTDDSIAYDGGSLISLKAGNVKIN